MEIIIHEYYQSDILCSELIHHFLEDLTFFSSVHATLGALKGNAQFIQKVTFEPSVDFKQNHYVS